MQQQVIVPPEVETLCASIADTLNGLAAANDMETARSTADLFVSLGLSFRFSLDGHGDFDRAIYASHMLAALHGTEWRFPKAKRKAKSKDGKSKPAKRKAA